MTLPISEIIEDPMFLICVSTGIISIIAGGIMLKFPPKEINHLYGYRTKSSMKNKERWKFAQRYSAYEMIRLGLVLTIIGVLGIFVPLPDMMSMIIGLTLMILTFVLLFFRVEKAIKERFPNE